jgi:hypothetical protein
MAALTAIGIGLLIAAAATKATADAKAGNAARRIGDYNANIAEQQRIDAYRRGEEEVAGFRRDVRGLIGEQRAGYAGQNVEVSSGTALAMQQSTEHLMNADLARIRRNAAREGMGYAQEAENYRRGGRQAQLTGRWGAASTVLGAASDTTLLAERYGWERRQARGGRA